MTTATKDAAKVDWTKPLELYGGEDSARLAQLVNVGDVRLVTWQTDLGTTRASVALDDGTLMLHHWDRMTAAKFRVRNVVAPAEQGKPDPHEPVPGVTLWQHDTAGLACVLDVLIDGEYVGDISKEGGNPDLRKNRSRSGEHNTPNTFALNHAAVEFLRVTRDRIRADRKAAKVLAEPKADAEKPWKPGQRFRFKGSDSATLRASRWHVENGRVRHTLFGEATQSGQFPTLESFSAAILSGELVPVEEPKAEAAPDYSRIVTGKREYRLRNSQGYERENHGVMAVSGDRSAYFHDGRVFIAGHSATELLSDGFVDRAAPLSPNIGAKLDEFWTKMGWDSTQPAPHYTRDTVDLDAWYRRRGGDAWQRITAVSLSGVSLDGWGYVTWHELASDYEASRQPQVESSWTAAKPSTTKGAA